MSLTGFSPGYHWPILPPGAPPSSTLSTAQSLVNSFNNAKRSSQSWLGDKLGSLKNYVSPPPDQPVFIGIPAAISRTTCDSTSPRRINRFDSLEHKLISGPLGPNRFLGFFRRVDNIIKFSANTGASGVSTTRSTSPPGPGILRPSGSSHGINPPATTTTPTENATATNVGDNGSQIPRPTLFDLARNAKYSFTGPPSFSGDPVPTGDDGSRVIPDVDLYDYCTSANGLAGLDQPLTAFENMSSWVQNRYRKWDDQSTILSREEARRIAPLLFQSGNDGTEESRTFISRGLDEIVTRKILPEISRDRQTDGKDGIDGQVLILDSELPTASEAAEGTDVAAWTGQSMDEWLASKIAPDYDAWGNPIEMSVLQKGRQALHNIRSMGSKMCQRHKLNPEMTTYLSSRIGSWMGESMAHSGRYEVTPELQAQADILLHRASSFLSGLSAEDRLAIISRKERSAAASSSSSAPTSSQSAPSSGSSSGAGSSLLASLASRLGTGSLGSMQSGYPMTQQTPSSGVSTGPRGILKKPSVSFNPNVFVTHI
ncbi:hypothetical protein IAT38_000395 [Cryptococcus sp. DSM 104549]